MFHNYYIWNCVVQGKCLIIIYLVIIYKNHYLRTNRIIEYRLRCLLRYWIMLYCRECNYLNVGNTTHEGRFLMYLIITNYKII